MAVVERPSPNHDARPGGVDMLVLHYTGMKTADEALARLCDPDAKVSAHYTIDRDGTIYAHVPEERRAWHAGVSFWAGARDINGCSIGIELVNPGHEFGYVPFPKAQIGALIDLADGILARHAIAPARVLGHSDVAPARKTDPGELFPWRDLAEFGIGLWPFVPSGLRPPPPTRSGEEKRGGADLPFLAREAGEVARVGATEGATMDFLRDLRAFGYGTAPDIDVPLETVIAAFQRHWRPARVDGIADEECAYRLGALVAALS